ncbi:uncharacterized protein LOC141797087 [Halichoeres trimaculatus]|uniref:uncharacterized protein LOC141797087 n=1 Tax=Halichoeres trimaculatus TaxID=147232 RepID=UPI003D9F04AF
MRLTALSVCGTLLAFFSLFWTTADSEEGDLLGDHEFGPCAATLRPKGPCGQDQDGSTCPYLLSLPPLTFHFPKQLRELEKIVEDLQELKDNVDQLRKMCADCTVSQTERECGRQRESEYYDVNEGTGGHMVEKNWLNERNPERLKNVSLGCGTDRAENIGRDADIDSEKRKKLEEEERNKWDAERGSDKKVVKDNEKEVAEKDGKTQTDEAKGKDKPGQPKGPTSSKNERPGDVGNKKVVDKYNRKTVTDMSKEKNEKENSKANPEGTLERGTEVLITRNIKNKEKIEDSEHYVWRDETKETGERTQTEEDRGSDGIKMSEGRNEHTNKERKQHREERRKEMEKGIKVERNNEKPKQTESIGRAEKERTIKEGAVEEDREMGKEIKTEGEKTVQSLQRDGGGELESSKSTEGTDLVSISPTDSIISAAPRHDSMDLNEAITITSSLPPPPVSSSTPHLITDVDQGKKGTAGGPTRSTGFRAGDFPKQPSPEAEAGLSSTTRTEGGPRQQRPSIPTWSTSTTSTQLGSGYEAWVRSTTTPTAAPHQSLYTTTSPRVSDRSGWAAKRNTSSNAKTGVKPLPGQAPKPSGRIKPEADQRPKHPKNTYKPDQALLPDKSIKTDQKKKPYQKPTTDQKTKTGKDPVRVHPQKPEQTPSPGDLPTDDLPTDEDLPNIQMPKHNRENTTDGNRIPPKKTKTHPKSLSPVLTPTSDQRPGTENTTGSHKDPLTDQDLPSVVQIVDHTLQPDQKLVHPTKSDKPEQNQKPRTKTEREEKTEKEPERSKTTSFIPNTHQTPLKKSTGGSDEDPLPGTRTIKDSTQGKTPDRSPIKPSTQRPKPSQKIPKINQKPKPGQASKPNPKNPKFVTGQKTKPNVKPKPDQTQTNRGVKTSPPDQMPNLGIKNLSEGNKTSSQSTPQRYRIPTRPTVKPRETPAGKPKPAAQPKQSSQIQTDPPKISGAFTDPVQNSQTDLPPASGHGGPHSPVDTKLKLKNQDHSIKTTTRDPKTSNSFKTEPLPRLQSHPEGFTMSPNSRIASDLGPKTVSQLPPIEMTTRLNKIMHGILPSVVTSTGPGSAQPNQASKADSSQKTMQETAPRPTPDPDKTIIPGPSTTTQTTSTTTSDLRSTTPATSASEYPADESTTPSARELRVKINQVAAFLNNSQSPNKRPPDRRTTELPEDSSRSARTDGKRPTLIRSRVKMLRRDCSDHLLRGSTESGVYVVTPDLRSRSFPVFCDMEQEDGGWTLLQRRQDGSVSFNRTWAEYRSGFGELNGGEFWLGNNMIHLLTRDRDMVLRVELEDFNGVVEYAEYEHFRVASERMRFRLTVGGYSGTAGDALVFSKTYNHNNRAFTTPDRDHDRYPSGNCGAYYSSGWWFDACMAANLNGRYYVGKYKGVRDGIFWGTWHNISTEYYPTNDRQSFKTVRMMIRPKGFTI